MIRIKKHSFIITIHTEEPAKHIASLNRALLNANRRMLNSEDLFNDPDTINDIETLMMLKEELLVGIIPPKKNKK